MTRLAINPTSRTISQEDFERTLDELPFGTKHGLVVLLAASAILANGAANQAIGYSLPSIAAEFSSGAGFFLPMLGLGLFGMMIGSLSAGLVADRIGRRPTLYACVILFAIATTLMSLASSVGVMIALRFFVGLGLGGALPCSTTLAGETTPKAWRTAMITIVILCVPLGGMLAGIAAELLLPSLGWRGLHVCIGAFGLIVGMILFGFVPESPRFLARKINDDAGLSGLLSRLVSRQPAQSSQTRAHSQSFAQTPGTNVKLADVISVRRDAFALCFSFFSCLFVVYCAFNWLPILLTSHGAEPSLAARGLTFFNLGGVIGPVACAFMIGQFGSRKTLVGFSLAATITAFCLAIGGADPIGIAQYLAIGLIGFFVNSVQSSLFVVAAHIFPTSSRAKGTSTALAAGFFGAILSTFAGGTLVTAERISPFFFALSILTLICAMSIFTVRNSIPPTVRSGPAKIS